MRGNYLLIILLISLSASFGVADYSQSACEGGGHAWFDNFGLLLEEFYFEEGGGAIVSSENHTSATLYGQTYFTTGRNGYALYFDGDGDYAVLDDAYNFTEGATVMAWFRRDVNTKNYWSEHVILSKGSVSYLPFEFKLLEYSATLYSGSAYIHNITIYLANSTAHTLSARLSNPLGRWTHVAFTYNKSTGNLRLYQDGVIIASSNYDGGIGATTHSLFIGSRPALENFFLGKVDELKIADYELTPEQVRNHMHANYAPCCGDDGALDFFNNDSLSTTNNFCYMGEVITQEIDYNETICQAYGFEWFQNGVGNNPSCCGDDLTLDNFHNGSSINSSEFCHQGIVINNDLDHDPVLCEALGLTWLSAPDVYSTTPRVMDTSLDSPRRVFTIDLNKDGYKDVIATGWNAGQVVWYENNGNKTFTKHIIDSDFPEDAPHEIFAADFNRDSYIDIAVSGIYGTYWYENDGTQSFIRHTINNTAVSNGVIYGADINGNGFIDLITGDGHNGTLPRLLSWYENDGLGNFTQHVLIHNFSEVRSVYADDINKDGLVDILAAGGNNDCGVWFENNGSNSFIKHTPLNDYYPDTYYLCTHIKSGDVNNDGSTDIVIMTTLPYEYAIVFYNLNMDFTRWVCPNSAYGTSSFDLVDIDYDGDLDIIYPNSQANRITIYRNDVNHFCNFSLNEHLVTGFSAPHYVLIDDLDADGDLDLIATSEANDLIYWWENLGINGTKGQCCGYSGRDEFFTNGSLTCSNGVLINNSELSDKADQLYTLDTMTDGRNYCEASGGKWFYNNNLLYNMTVLRSGGNSIAYRGPSFGDLNGNGITDMVFIKQFSMTADIYINFNDGYGNYDEHIYPAPNMTYTQEIGDVNGNGCNDIILGSIDNLYVMFNDCLGNFTTKLVYPLFPTYNYQSFDIELVDFNGDGWLDIFSGGSHGIYYFENTDGLGNYSFRIISTDYTLDMDLGDVDLDGDIDLIYGRRIVDSNTTVILFNDGLGNFTEYVLDTEPYGTSTSITVQSVELADVNGNGALDLITGWFSTYERNATLWINDGAGRFSREAVWAGESARLADLNNDGYLDILFLAWYKSLNRLINDGTGIFNSESFTPWNYTAAVKTFGFTDFDYDGDLDILTGGTAPTHTYLVRYENLGMQGYGGPCCGNNLIERFHNYTDYCYDGTTNLSSSQTACEYFNFSWIGSACCGDGVNDIYSSGNEYCYNGIIELDHHKGACEHFGYAFFGCKNLHNYYFIEAEAPHSNPSPAGITGVNNTVHSNALASNGSYARFAHDYLSSYGHDSNIITHGPGMIVLGYKINFTTTGEHNLLVRANVSHSYYTSLYYRINDGKWGVGYLTPTSLDWDWYNLSSVWINEVGEHTLYLARRGARDIDVILLTNDLSYNVSDSCGDDVNAIGGYYSINNCGLEPNYCIKNVNYGVSAGGWHSCVLNIEGNVTCWGMNWDGQAANYSLGDGVAVSAGGWHSCVLKDNGDVTCWGLNTQGQSANYSLGDAVAVSAGHEYSCVLKSDGDVACWGENVDGQSANYSLGDAVAVSAGFQHSCVLKSDGDVACWGSNEYGQAANYSLSDAVSVSAGFYHSCVLKDNGSVACWGWNAHGQIANYTGGDGVAVSAGGYHSCVLKSNGDVACWGSNEFGQAANYTQGDAIAVSAGGYHSCVLKLDGDVTCWGANSVGQSNPYTGTESYIIRAECCGDDGVLDNFHNWTQACAGGVLVFDPDEAEFFCSSLGHNWLSGTNTGVNHACCGDDGASDLFYNATSGYGGFCTNGVYYYGDADDDEGACSLVGEWLSGAVGSPGKCCGDDGALDDFGNFTHSCCCNGVVISDGMTCDLDGDGNIDSVCENGRLPEIFVSTSDYESSYLGGEYFVRFLVRNTGEEAMHVLSSNINVELSYIPDPNNPVVIQSGSSGTFTFNFGEFGCESFGRIYAGLFNLTYNTSSGGYNELQRNFTFAVKNPLDITAVSWPLTSAIPLKLNDYGVLLITLSNLGRTPIEYKPSAVISQSLIVTYSANNERFSNSEYNTENFLILPGANHLIRISIIPTTVGDSAVQLSFTSTGACSNITDSVSFKVTTIAPDSGFFGVTAAPASDYLSIFLLVLLASLMIYFKSKP